MNPSDLTDEQREQAEKDVEQFGLHVLEALLQKAEPLLRAQLAERGVTSPKDLPADEARELFLSAIKRTAVTHFPATDIEKLERGFRAFADPAFGEAHKHLRDTPQAQDAFQPAIGEHAAVIMAGVGVPVAAVNLDNPFAPIEYSNDITTVQQRFRARPDAIVGCCSARAEFYSLSTDCVRTLRYKMKYTKEARPIGSLIRRYGMPLPDAKEPFVHFSCVFSRRPGDRIPTINVFDDRKDKGSIMLLAGWVDVNNHVRGAPRDGLAPVPLNMARQAALDPKFAYWLTEPHDAHPISMH